MKLKRLSLFFLLALICFAQQSSTLTTIPDLSMTGSAVPLTSGHTYVHWCQFVAPSGNAAVIRWGDSTVSSSRGSSIAAGAGQSIPSSGPVYDLSTIYFLGTSGDKIQATCQVY